MQWNAYGRIAYFPRQRVMLELLKPFVCSRKVTVRSVWLVECPDGLHKPLPSSFGLLISHVDRNFCLDRFSTQAYG